MCFRSLYKNSGKKLLSDRNPLTALLEVNSEGTRLDEYNFAQRIQERKEGKAKKSSTSINSIKINLKYMHFSICRSVVSTRWQNSFLLS